MNKRERQDALNEVCIRTSSDAVCCHEAAPQGASFKSATSLAAVDKSREEVALFSTCTCWVHFLTGQNRSQVRILASSVRSPNLVRYYDSFFEKDALWIVTELARGGDVGGKIKRHRARKVP